MQAVRTTPIKTIVGANRCYAVCISGKVKLRSLIPSLLLETNGFYSVSSSAAEWAGRDDRPTVAQHNKYPLTNRCISALVCLTTTCCVLTSVCSGQIPGLRRKSSGCKDAAKSMVNLNRSKSKLSIIKCATQCAVGNGAASDASVSIRCEHTVKVDTVPAACRLSKPCNF